MRLLFDECAHRSVGQVFRERGHEVLFVIDELTAQTPDDVVALHAHRIDATVVTWNYKHYVRLHNRRHSSGSFKFPKMGLLAFRCQEVNGVARLRCFIELIEYEHALASSAPDGRFHVVVGHDCLRTFR